MNIKRNLLDFLQEVKEFPQFEKKLSELTDDKLKGDLFEVFCQAYLIKIHPQNFKFVRPFEHPENLLLLDKLNLRLKKDYGIDLVAETDSGEIWTIQAKFRSSNILSWRELSTFRDSSRNANFMLVIGNLNQILHPFKVIENFSSILRADLDRLTEEDFRLIRQYLGSSEKIIPFQPREHQIKAINNALDYYKQNDKGQMIHACGTGKTLTSLWIKEQFKPSNSIVFVPSLSLLKQTLEEWFKHKSSNFSIKCVCSDKTVAEGYNEFDEQKLDPTELGIPVTTNPEEVASFLKRNGNEKIIFSTYQSAPVILEAIRNFDNFMFDFGVFDEAHRTASIKDRLFSTCLKVPIKKKLFMTATPKIYQPHLKRMAKEEDIELCSMDDEEKYGKIFDEIKFGQAIKFKLLSDYKIKIIIVSDDNIKELIDRRYWLSLLNKDLTADELAKIWALIQAMKDVNHVISFHSKVKKARDFETNLQNAINYLKQKNVQVPTINSYHISGTFPAYKRSMILKEFISKEKSLVTNARCLTEGIDVPAIDGVYFVDPKNNLIDIVQATGRAIRRKKDNTQNIGYIIIPIFVGNEKDIEKLVESSAFYQVWEVVQAMKDQDEELALIIDKLRMLEGKRKIGSIKSRELSEYRELRSELGNKLDLELLLPNKFDLDKFIDKVSLKTVETTGSSWMVYYLKVKQFREENPALWPMRGNKIERELAKWCSRQRVLFKQNRLSKERIKKLNELNFIWIANGSDFETWMKYYNDLIAFRKQNPNRWPTFSRGAPKEEHPLGKWVAHQRQKNKQHKLEEKRLELLKNINFDFEPMSDINKRWLKNYNLSIAYFKKKGFWPKYINPKAYALKLGYTAEEWEIGRWCWMQRMEFKRRKLSQEKVKMLNEVNFDWQKEKKGNYKPESWNQNFKKLVEFREKNPGKWPQPYNEDEKELHHFVKGQKRFFVAGKLTPERIKKLRDIDFPLMPRKYVRKSTGSK